MPETTTGPHESRRKRRLSRKIASSELLPQHFEYENQYEKWRAENPRTSYEFSVDESGYTYWIWTCVVSCGCLYNIIMLSVLAFENVRYAYRESVLPLNIAFDLVFVIDIIIRARLSFYEDGVMVTDFHETRLNYCYSLHFVFDILALVPFDYIFPTSTSSAFCRLNRLLKLYRIAEFFAQSYGKLGQVSISLTKIIGSCFLLFHCNACVFYLISVNSDSSMWDGVNATFDDDEFLPWPYLPEKITDAYFVACDGETTCYNDVFYFDEEREEHLIELYQFWRLNNRTNVIQFSTFTKEYTLSMYWSAMTMTTLGEQPAPNTSVQNIFEILNTLIGLLLFAVIMGSVGELVANANKVKTFWQTLMDGLKQYMIYRNLHNDLQMKVLKYCEYEMAEETIMKEHEVRDELPTKLYGHVTTSIIGKSLLKSPMFRASERSFVNDISEYLEPHYYCPGDIVVEKGQLCTAMFIIVCGQMIEMTETEEILHNEGEVLCDMNLIWFENHKLSNRHANNFVSNAYSQIHILNRDDFLKVLSAYDCGMKKRICDIAYRMQRQKNQVDDLKRKIIEKDDLETNIRKLTFAAAEIDETLNTLESEFLGFTKTAKQRIFKAEVTMCSLLKIGKNHHHHQQQYGKIYF